MTSQTTHEMFRVTDFGTACALVAIRHPVQAIEWRTPTRAEFIFDWSEALDRDVQRYANGELEVFADEMHNAMRSLKNRLHASREVREHVERGVRS